MGNPIEPSSVYFADEVLRTVSVQLRNGTYVDLGKIEGSHAYLALMKQFAEDASSVARNEPPIIPPLNFDRPAPAYDPRWPDAYQSLGTIPKMIKMAMKPFQSFLQDANTVVERPLPPADVHTKPLLDMVTSLTQKAKFAYPDTADFVFFGTPDTLRIDTSIVPRLRLACRLAGFEEWGRNVGSSMLAVSDYFQFAHESNEDDFSLQKQARALVIQHTQAALSLAIITTDDGKVHELSKTASYVKPPNDPSNPTDRKKFAQNAPNAIREFLKKDNEKKQNFDLEFDDVFLLGDQASQPEFIEAIEKVFHSEESNKKKSRIRTLDTKESTFASARGAARLARFGLLNAFNGCVPNDGCPSPPEDESEDISSDKSEL
ncbi:hypothetical protein NA57DRAFT_53738 [Rhizodiscina lignyota]|uniref:Uncharacterized protein n=1 Tax=Rhizodiscina lignyota TaxID=1504668 RepID=A0A9P4IPA9_9PEZI|nr:hypothetical protein NA57DRAFT_53738 [Rhizodiscina lignyota]